MNAAGRDDRIKRRTNSNKINVSDAKQQFNVLFTTVENNLRIRLGSGYVSRDVRQGD